jgi:hypothetical protein
MFASSVEHKWFFPLWDTGLQTVCRNHKTGILSSRSQFFRSRLPFTSLSFPSSLMFVICFNFEALQKKFFFSKLQWPHSSPKSNGKNQTHLIYVTHNHTHTYLLTYGAEIFLRSCQLCSPSRTPQLFMEPEGSIHNHTHTFFIFSIQCIFHYWAIKKNESLYLNLCTLFESDASYTVLSGLYLLVFTDANIAQ